MKTWVVVGSRVGARIFEHKGPGKELVRVQSHSHPDGRKLSSEIDTDRAGRSFNRAGPGGGANSAGHGAMGHSMSRVVEAHDHEAQVFARELSTELTAARSRNEFDRLVLVAEPKFLGMLRDSLDSVTSKLVRGSIAKDLDHLTAQEIAPHLASVLAV